MDSLSSPHIEECEPDVPDLDVIYLDHCPVKAARVMADQHLPRMLRAAAVLLSNAWWNDAAMQITYGCSAVGQSGCMGLLYDGLEVFGKGYKPKTRADNWVQASEGNYRWLWRHAMALADEMHYRFSTPVALACVVCALENPPLLPNIGRTEPPVVRERSRVVDAEGYVDAVPSFRLYYKQREMQLTWTRRDLPEWVE